MPAFNPHMSSEKRHGTSRAPQGHEVRSPLTSRSQGENEYLTAYWGWLRIRPLNAPESSIKTGIIIAALMGSERKISAQFPDQKPWMPEPIRRNRMPATSPYRHPVNRVIFILLHCHSDGITSIIKRGIIGSLLSGRLMHKLHRACGNPAREYP
jgi:hypothetical protein